MGQFDLFCFFFLDVSNISVVAYVEDTVKITNDTKVHVNILQNSLIDCDLMTRDLCYWQSATYRIFENSEPSVIGSLSSSYLAEICTKHKINYTLIKGKINCTFFIASMIFPLNR